MKILWVPVYILFFSGFLPFPIFAQGKVGINTTSPAAMLHVKDSSVVFTGTSPLPVSPGNPPVSGPGTRMMWYPDKAAFRAGVALGQQWNKDSVGLYSVAMGYGTRASGEGSIGIGSLMKADGHYAISLGVNNTASGQQSAALGSFLITSGNWSTAIGVGNRSTANASTAIGSNTLATGNGSVAIGSGTIANTVGMFAAGSQNDTVAGSPVTFLSNDHLFVIGNGIGGIRSNALTVLKNGKTGIGTITPKSLLHLRNGLAGFDPHVNAVATLESNTNTAIHLLMPVNNSGSIYFGNVANNTHGSISYGGFFFPNSMSFSTNGTTRMSISNIGNVGIGTADPEKLLHVYSGSSGATPAPSALGVFEDNTDVAINLITPVADESGLFFGNPLHAAHGGLVYNSDVANGLAFRTNGNITRAVINEFGNMGIGTIAPQKLLHVRNGVSGGLPAPTSVSVFESSGNVSINLLTPNANSGAVFFGNVASSQEGGIAYNAVAPEGLDFRTNGNAVRAVISDIGNFGIGDNTPNAKLHISDGTGGGTYNANSKLIIEDDNQSYIQFSVPTSEESGILSGNNVTSFRSAIIFRADSSLQLRSGGNTTRLVATKAGNVGINTLSPGARLDVNGTMIIGTNGTVLTEVIKATILTNVDDIPANSSINVDFNIPDAALGSSVHISPGSDLTAGIIIGYARVSSAGNVRVRFTNTTGAAIDLANMNYYITVIR